MYLKVVDFGLLLVLLLVRYDLNDLTSAEKLYAKTTDYFNEGYLQDGLLITMICLFVWSFIAKTFYFVGIYSMKKYFFAAVSSYWTCNIYAQFIKGKVNTQKLWRKKNWSMICDFFIIRFLHYIQCNEHDMFWFYQLLITAFIFLCKVYKYFFLSVLLFWIFLSHNSFCRCWI